jgi:hypothetical protein
MPLAGGTIPPCSVDDRVLVLNLRSGSTPRKLDRYTEVLRRIDALWRDHGGHVFLHHLNALFGYAPVRPALTGTAFPRCDLGAHNQHNQLQEERVLPSDFDAAQGSSFEPRDQPGKRDNIA